MGYEGFRKELFGYNKDDVTRFIEQVISNNEKHVAELTETIDALRAENNAFRAKSAKVDAEMEKAQKLSEAVGKLYVISQANAAALQRAAESNMKLSLEASKKGIADVTAVQNGVEDAGRKISDMIAELSREIEQISASLEDTKSALKTSGEELGAVADEAKETMSKAECKNA